MNESVPIENLAVLYHTGRLRLPPLQPADENKWFPRLAMRIAIVLEAEKERDRITVGEPDLAEAACDAFHELVALDDGAWWEAVYVALRPGSAVLRELVDRRCENAHCSAGPTRNSSSPVVQRRS